jgi:hypothetical protein
MLRPAGKEDMRANPTAAGSITNGALKRLSKRNRMKIDFLAAFTQQQEQEAVNPNCSAIRYDVITNTPGPCNARVLPPQTLIFSILSIMVTVSSYSFGFTKFD